MEVIQSPDQYDWTRRTERPMRMIFLGGAIDQNDAQDWQAYTIDRFSCIDDLIVYNPRRTDWNTAWSEDDGHPEQVKQIEWELLHLCRCGFVLMHFPSGSIAPISLMELGMIGPYTKLSLIRSGVSCSDGYWRKTNVDVFSKTYGIPVFETLDENIDYFIDLFS